MSIQEMREDGGDTKREKNRQQLLIRISGITPIELTVPEILLPYKTFPEKGHNKNRSCKRITILR
jgi:hypothetical protein